MKRLLIILVVFLAGCGGKTPELTQYLLRADASGQTTEPAVVSIGIGELTVAHYIDDPGLVIESSDGEVRAARHHQWAEPLRESLRGYLANEIATASGHPIGGQEHKTSSWKRRIDIHIDQLHGNMDGEATLVAQWALIDTARLRLLAEEHYSGTEPLSGDGYEALVRAEKILLSRLAVAIAATLN
jgi:uncharacterized lipoprotein YmbA